MSLTEDQAAPRPFRISTDRLLAFSAVMLSMAALVVSVLQTKILREQQRASVWPHLQLETSRMDAEYGLILYNNGVGPAVVTQVEIRYRGEVYGSLKDVFNADIGGRPGADTMRFGHYYSGLEPGDVLAVQQEVSLFRVVNSAKVAEMVFGLFQGSVTDLTIRYADVYGNEWELKEGVVHEY